MSVPTLMDPHAGIVSVTADPVLRRALEVVRSRTRGRARLDRGPVD